MNGSKRLVPSNWTYPAVTLPEPRSPSLTPLFSAVLKVQPSPYLVNPAGDLERAALARILERKTDNTRDRIAGLLRCTCWLKSVCLVDRSFSQVSTSTGMGRSTCVGGLPRKPTTVIDASDSASVAVLEPASSGGVVSALWAWAVTGISAATATVTSSSVWLLLAFPPAFCCMQGFKFAG